MAKREDRAAAEASAKVAEDNGNREMARIVPAGTSRAIKYISSRKLFETAADAYRIAGKWRSASRSLAYAAEAESRRGRPRDAATYYLEAGDYAARSDHEFAIEQYGKAITIMAREGQFPQAAAVQRRVAEMHAEDGDTTAAAVAWAFTAELYLSGHMTPQSVLALHRAGRMYVESEAYLDAHRTFHQASKVARDDNVLQFRIPLLLFDACLALLGTGEIPDFEDFLARAAVEDMNFAGSRERRFLLHVVECAVRADLEGFLDHAWNLDYVLELQPHQLKLLERVYRMFTAEVQEEAIREREAADAARLAAKLAKINAPAGSPPRAAGGSGGTGGGQAAGAGAGGGGGGGGGGGR